MQDQAYQKMYLEAIFSCNLFAPVLKHHPGYCVAKFAHLVPYISYNDVINNKFIIRGRLPGAKNTFDCEEREIIVAYASLDELVNAGWCLQER